VFCCFIVILCAVCLPRRRCLASFKFFIRAVGAYLYVYPNESAEGPQRSDGSLFVSVAVYGECRMSECILFDLERKWIEGVLDLLSAGAYQTERQSHVSDW